MYITKQKNTLKYIVSYYIKKKIKDIFFIHIKDIITYYMDIITTTSKIIQFTFFVKTFLMF